MTIAVGVRRRPTARGAHRSRRRRPDLQPDPELLQPAARAPDTFTYTLNGGSPATVAVTVTCVDDAPVAVDDAPRSPRTRARPDRRARQRHRRRRRPMTIVRRTQPANGTACTVSPDGHTGLTTSPTRLLQRAGPAPDTFTYTLNGGSTATVSVTVTCVDDAPGRGRRRRHRRRGLGRDRDRRARQRHRRRRRPEDDRVGDPTRQRHGRRCGSPAGAPGSPTSRCRNCNAGGRPDTFTYTAQRRLDRDRHGHGDLRRRSRRLAVDDAATVAEDSGATAIDVLANDTDADGGPKTIASASARRTARW